MKRVYCSLLIIGLFCSGFLLMYLQPLQAEKPMNDILFEKISPSAYISHDPINITSDDDFSSYSFAGDGSFQNPYLIEGLSIINSTSPFGILINNTASHFIVRNCYLETNAYGLVIENVANNTAIVMDNFAFGNDAGAFVLKSTHYAIVSNNVAELDRVGINITNCFGVYVGNNTLTGGIPVVGYSCHSGIVTDNCENIIVLNNSISSFNNGFYSKKSTEMFLENNTILNSIEDYGIYLTDHSNFNHIINNTVFNSSTWDGIHLTESSDNEITFNTVRNSTFYGCNLQTGSIDNVIHHNIFINNNNDVQQGYATSLDNSWYDISSSEGNFWSDWDESGAYDLAGVGQDLYPLNVTHHANWSVLSSPVPNIDDDFEENDSWFISPQIASNTLYTNLLANDVDYFTISLTRDDTIYAEINFNSELGSLELYFINFYAGTFINLSSTSGTVSFIHDCTMTDFYFIAVLKKNTIVPFLTYSLETSLTTQPISDDSYEDNDSFATAKPVAKNIVHDLVYKDPDYFQFTIAESSTIEVTVNFESQYIDLDIYLLPDYFNGSWWQVLALSERSTSPESFIYDSEYTGTHILLVRIFGDLVSPQSYTLLVNTDVTTDQVIIQGLCLTLLSLISLLGLSKYRKKVIVH